MATCIDQTKERYCKTAGVARKTKECIFGKVQVILIVSMIIGLDVSNAEKITGVNNKTITIECNENFVIILMPNGDLCSDGGSTTLPCGHLLDRTLLEECNLKRRCEPVLSNVPKGKTMEITYYCVLASKVYDICQLATITTGMGGFYLKSEDYPKGGTTQSCSCTAKSIDSIPIRVTFRDMFFTTLANCDKREYLEITTTNDALQPPNVVHNCKNMDINKAIYQLGGKATDVAIKYTRKNGPPKIDPGRFRIEIVGPAALEWSCKKDSSTTIAPPLLPPTPTKTGTISPTSFENPTTDMDNVATVGNLSEGETTSTSKGTYFIQSSFVNVITEAPATAAVDVTTKTPATAAVDVTTETPATAAVDVTTETPATAAVDVTATTEATAVVDFTTEAATTAAVDVTTKTEATAAVDFTTEAATTSAVDVTTKTPATAAVDVTTEAATTAAVDVTTEAATTSAVDVTTKTPATAAVDVTTEAATTAAVDVTTEAATTSAVDVTTKTPATAAVDVTTEAATTAAVDVTTKTPATAAVDVTTEAATTSAVDVTTKTPATAVVDFTTEAEATATVGVTTKTAENGDSGAFRGGIIAGIVLFVLLNVAIAIILGRIKRRPAASKAKRENYSSTSDTDGPYGDIALGPDRALRTPNQKHSYDNAAFNRSDADGYSEISGTTSQVKTDYSLQLPNPDSCSVSSGERTPEYHVLEPDGPPVYYELESDIANRFNFKNNAGDEIYTSLQPTGSGTQTPVYQSLHADNTSSVFFPTIATEPEHKLGNTAVDPVPDVKIVDGGPNQEEYSLVGNAQGPKQAQGDHRALPLISVNDAGVDSCNSSLPISYDYVWDIETMKAREKGSHSEFKPLDNGDVHIELVADDQPCKDNVSQGSYDYVYDVDKMPKSSKSGQGEKYLNVSRDQNSDERHKDGNLETDDNDPNYLEFVADADHTNDGYLRPKASNQEDNSSAEYDYTYL